MTIKINEQNYELIDEFKSGWNAEAVKNRWNDILDKYDYIVGDWGYEQLRLKGFYDPGNKKATSESNIRNVRDYLEVYCNFNCAYFILQKVSK